MIAKLDTNLRLYHNGSHKLGRTCSGLCIWGPARQAGHTAPGGGNPRTLRRPFGVGRVGSYRDVMPVVAVFLGKLFDRERCAGCQLQRVPAFGALERFGQIRVCSDPNLPAWGGSTVEPGVVTGLREFGGAVLRAKF